MMRVYQREQGESLVVFGDWLIAIFEIFQKFGLDVV